MDLGANATYKYRPTAGIILSSKTLRALFLVRVTLAVLGSTHRHRHNKTRPVGPEVIWDGPDDVDWSRFAYMQYATSSEYLCHSVMLFARLHELNSRPDRVLLYPLWMTGGADTYHGRLLQQAREEDNVKFVPIHVQTWATADDTWAESLTKLLAFNQTEYARVLSLVSDSLVLQAMDELFLTPRFTVAMPRTYWLALESRVLSLQVLLIEPSEKEFARVMAVTVDAGAAEYDMEILNRLYGDHAIVLPHRPCDLITSEFRYSSLGPAAYARYLGTADEPWDPVAVLGEAKFLHFSDWPAPKPWLEMSDDLCDEFQPPCWRVADDGSTSCVEHELWNSFYDEFQRRRDFLCNSNGRK